MTSLQFVGVLMVVVPIIVFVAFLAREGCLADVLIPLFGSLAISAFITTGIFLAAGGVLP